MKEDPTIIADLRVHCYDCGKTLLLVEDLNNLKADENN